MKNKENVVKKFESADLPVIREGAQSLKQRRDELLQEVLEVDIRLNRARQDADLLQNNITKLEEHKANAITKAKLCEVMIQKFGARSNA